MISWAYWDNLTGVNHFEYSLDNNSFISCGNETSLNLSNLSDGEHQLVIRGVDEVGNIAEEEITFEINTNIFSMKGPYGPWLLIAIITGVIIAIALLLYFLRPKKGSPEVSSIPPEPQ